MEFLEDNPNFEINLQNNNGDSKKLKRKKPLKILKNSLSSNSFVKYNNKQFKDMNSNVLIFNINIDKPTIIYDSNHKIIKKNPSISAISSQNLENSEFLNKNENKIKKKNRSDLIDSMRNDNKLKEINDILDCMKSKSNYHLSTNTDLKLYGELFPGPGQYDPQAKIYENKNLRYNNLYLKDEEPNLTLKLKLEKDNYFNNNLGPGYYNPNEGVIYKSYSQNPKIFISKLGRGPLFKIKESIGPGQYNISKNFYKNTKRSSLTNNFKTKKFFIRKNPTNLKLLDTEYINTFITDISNVNSNITSIQNNNNTKENRNESLNNSGTIENLITERKSKNPKKLKNYSWKGNSDFSFLGTTKSNNEVNIMSINDSINYRKQFFNFENQNKLNHKNHPIDPISNGKLKNELLKYNKFNLPLIQNVQRDYFLKVNHVPGPCYYKYLNNSIEDDIQKLIRKNKSRNKWI